MFVLVDFCVAQPGFLVRRVKLQLAAHPVSLLRCSLPSFGCFLFATGRCTNSHAFFLQEDKEKANEQAISAFNYHLAYPVRSLAFLSLLSCSPLIRLSSLFLTVAHHNTGLVAGADHHHVLLHHAAHRHCLRGTFCVCVFFVCCLCFALSQSEIETVLSKVAPNGVGFLCGCNVFLLVLCWFVSFRVWRCPVA